MRVTDPLAVEILTSTMTMLGPTGLGDRSVIALGGELRGLDPSGVTAPFGEGRPLTCLDGIDDTVTFGCGPTRVVALDPSGMEVERFKTAEVLAPIFEGLDSGDALACQLQWLDFASEAGLDPTLVVPDPPAITEEPAIPPGGCASVEPSALALPLLFGLITVNRGRRALGRRAEFDRRAD